MSNRPATTNDDFWKSRGVEVEEKAAKTLSVLLRTEGAGLYRVHCQHCQTFFDVFGILTRDEDGKATEVSVIEQRIIEHLGPCGRMAGVLIGHEQIRSIEIQQNTNTPQHFKATTVWK